MSSDTTVRVARYGRDASDQLAHVIASAKLAGPLAPVTVIVPTNMVGLAVRRLLGEGAVGPGHGIANVSFLTPFRLADLLAADRLLDKQPLTNPVLGAAVRLALAVDPGDFAKVAGHHSTQNALASLYTELSQLTTATRARIADQGGYAGKRAVRLHQAIASHLGGFHDEADVARAAATRVDLAEAVAPFGHVIWFLPAPTTAPMLEFLAAVFASAPTTVIVGLTGARDADQPVLDTCRKAGIRVDTPPIPPATADHVVSVTDADEEVRAVTRRIATLATEGTRLDRIGVFYPSAQPYAGIIEEHLAAAEIPTNGPSRSTLATSIAGRTLLDAFALPRLRWRRDKVMALVSSAPIRHDDEHHVRPSVWETLSRDAGIIRDLADWRAKLEHSAARAAQARADLKSDAPEWRHLKASRELDDIASLTAFVDQLASAIEAVEAGVGWKEKAAAASDLLAGLLGPGHRHDHWPEPEQAAFERVQDALVRLAKLEELEPAPPHDVFLQALSAELGVTRGRSGRFGHGVLHGPLSAALGMDLDAVFILGCTEGLCPGQRRDDALLPDVARRLTDGDLRLNTARLDEQHRQFLAALETAPAGSRTLVFPRGDLRGGRTALPSRWLLDSVSARAGETVFATTFDDLGPELVEVVPSHATGLRTAPVHASVHDFDLATLATHQAGGGVVLDHSLATLVWPGLAAQNQRRSDRLTEWDGNLDGQPMPPTTERPVSATRLQTWASCGFRYFLGDVLGLSDRDDPESITEISALDKGSGVHTALEKFMLEAIEAGAPGPDQQWSAHDRERLQTIARDVFDSYQQQGRTGRSLHWQQSRAELLDLLDDFLTADDAHRAATRSTPVRLELPFGLADHEPLEIELGDGRKLSFRGLIDRVDQADDGAWLVSDYKTGKGANYKKIEDDDPVQGGTTLQLGLYAEAAASQLGGNTRSAHYWMVNADVNHARYGYAWDDTRRQRFVEVVTTIVDGIEAGAFPAVPGEWDSFRNTFSNCVYCPFDSVCPRDRGEHAQMKLADPAVRRRDTLAWSSEPTVTEAR